MTIDTVGVYLLIQLTAGGFDDVYCAFAACDYIAWLESCTEDEETEDNKSEVDDDDDEDDEDGEENENGTVFYDEEMTDEDLYDSVVYFLAGGTVFEEAEPETGSEYEDYTEVEGEDDDDHEPLEDDEGSNNSDDEDASSECWFDDFIYDEEMADKDLYDRVVYCLAGGTVFEEAELETGSEYDDHTEVEYEDDDDDHELLEDNEGSNNSDDEDASSGCLFDNLINNEEIADEDLYYLVVCCLAAGFEESAGEHTEDDEVTD